MPDQGSYCGPGPNSPFCSMRPRRGRSPARMESTVILSPPLRRAAVAAMAALAITWPAMLSARAQQQPREGLSRTSPAFGDTTRPDAYVATASRDAALRRLRYGLEHGRGPALLFGPSGSGKTLVARTLARDLGAPTTHLVFPALP